MLNEELLNDFIEEALSHSSNVEKCLLQLSFNKENIECINEIFRSVHSIKGTASFFQFNKIVNLSHSMENLFGKIRSNEYKLKENDIDILFSANDCLKNLIENIFQDKDIRINNIINKIEEISSVNEEYIEKNQIDKNLNSFCSDNKISQYCDKSMFSKITKEIIADAKKRGHLFYVVKINSLKDLKEHDLKIEDFTKLIESIGQIVDTYKDCNYAEEEIHFLISSVLEKSLICIALNIDEDKICEYTVEEYDLKQYELKEQHKNVIKEKLEIQNEKHTAIKNLHKEESIRVKVSLLNDLLNLTGELVLARNQLLRTMENHRKDIENIDNILQNIDSAASNLQEKVMQTRMQPISNIFDKFPRIVRDLSRSLNKNINLELEGSSVELDKSIIESLSDPLIHLVRNAADHGLESKEEREAKGKDKAGNITLKAYYKAGYVIIDVIDDGRGIDTDILKRTALEKGLVCDNDILQMNDKEIIELIFKPGFSTIDSITNVSGRGVGMDVVKTNIKKLGGNIEIYTKHDKETTIRLIIPLTLAIISTLIVESNNQKFAIPQINIKEIVRITPKDSTKRIEYLNNIKVLRLREKILPIVALSEVLGCGYSDYNSDYCKKIIRVLVLKVGFKEFAVMVDEIFNDEEILVKSLPRYIKDSQCYSGVTILGDGRVAAILDVNGIYDKAKLKLSDKENFQMHKHIDEKIKYIDEKRSLLLFKCSKQETFALDLSFVQRVEEIYSHEIELIGDKEYIKFRENSLRIIRPSNYIPVSESENNTKKYYVIIPKLIKHPVGILIDKIYDTVETDIKLNNDDVDFKGVLGTTIINNKIILLINIYELLEIALPNKYKNSYVNITNKKEKVILLVEDTDVFLKQEKSYIESAGYKVITSTNGKEALDILHSSNIDLVISDIIMPIMDGLELVKKIKSNIKLKNIPVIALTSITLENKKQEGLESGFDAYEYKLDREALITAIEKFLD